MIKHEHVWKTVGGNPYKGTARWAIDHFSFPKKIKTQVLENIQQGKFRWVDIHSGMKISAVTFGQNKIWKKVLTQWDLTRLFAAKDYGVGKYHVVKVLWCGNWATWWKSLPESTNLRVTKAPISPIKVKPKPQPAPILPPIFKKEKTRVIFEHELDAGGGLWWNKNNSIRGQWWYAQYKIYLHQMERYLADLAAGGTLIPEIGVFTRGDLGKTDAGYKWNNWGIGPEAGSMWSGLTATGYPQSSQLVFRMLWEHCHGKNSSSSYHKDEDHFLLGYYGEYIRRFAPDKMNVLYSEGWVDMDKHINSTWPGDEASNRTNFVVGYQFHKDWNDSWASRFGVQVGFAPEEHQWGLNFRTEARYNDWLMFGPSLDYTIASDIAGVAGSYSYGPFLRVELHKLITEKYSVIRTKAVQPADHDLLTY